VSSAHIEYNTLREIVDKMTNTEQCPSTLFVEHLKAHKSEEQFAILTHFSWER